MVIKTTQQNYGQAQDDGIIILLLVIMSLGVKYYYVWATPTNQPKIIWFYVDAKEKNCDPQKMIASIGSSAKSDGEQFLLLLN